MMKHYFLSEVWQPAETSTRVSIPSSRDLFRIKFQLFRVTKKRGTGRTEEEEEEEEEEEPKLVAERQTKPLSRGLLLSSWTRNSLVIWNGTLSGMGVPQEEQPAIVAKIFEALRVAVPFRPIFVVIKGIVTMQEHINVVGETSSNQVTFDSLEAKKEECAICLDDDISDFGPKSVTHLPCSHTYHKDCIRKWQETRRYLCSCPKCRYPIPIAETAGEPSEPVSWTYTAPEYQYIHDQNVDLLLEAPTLWLDVMEVAASLLGVPLCSTIIRHCLCDY